MSSVMRHRKRIFRFANGAGYFYTELTTSVLDTKQFQGFAQTHVPMKRYGKEGELNAGAVFLASSEASYVTGVILPIDGGYTCV